jgi:ketopantoate reductase
MVMSTSSSSNDFSSTKGTRTSVAVVGSGAVGGYYGSRLWEAGHDVKFHMRGEHYQQSKTNGLNVTVSDHYECVIEICLPVLLH